MNIVQVVVQVADNPDSFGLLLEEVEVLVLMWIKKLG